MRREAQLENTEEKLSAPISPVASGCIEAPEARTSMQIPGNNGNGPALVKSNSTGTAGSTLPPFTRRRLRRKPGAVIRSFEALTHHTSDPAFLARKHPDIIDASEGQNSEAFEVGGFVTVIRLPRNK
ncbi:hypothetical protein TGRH88_059370 [Toxoplasma gondii]|uniref:Uncharacterized protein n=1 Tax=Toxoplasma gondii TaxID=5811 RepID=A0A7J6JV04_TOXGO|nr:hypothetical protein TGRH88_059370 [Toxoplasma gondii]